MSINTYKFFGENIKVYCRRTGQEDIPMIELSNEHPFEEANNDFAG